MSRLFPRPARRTGLRRPARRGRATPLAAELLEERTLLTAWVVDTLADTVVNDGRISLREAVQAANTNNAARDAAAGQGGGVIDTITFAPSLSGAGIFLASGPLVVFDRLTISGTGVDLRISGSDGRRVFDVQSSAVAEISYLRISDGYVLDGLGGGIRNAGTLSLTGCIVTDNVADSTNGVIGGGGGIANSGTLTVDRCFVTGNRGFIAGGIHNSGTLEVKDSQVLDNLGGGGGGGIWNRNTLSVSRCMISGNRGSVGGGIVNFGVLSVADVADSTVSGNTTIDTHGGGIYSEGGLTLTNSTVSGNSAADSGGGIYVAAEATATLRNATVVGNIADSDTDADGFGGGIVGAATLYNTLVAGNSRMVRGSRFPIFVADDVRGTLGPGSSHNLIGDAGTAGGLTNGANGNIVGVDWETVFDPVLRDNGGGRTLTHRLLVGSPAIDAGSDRQALGPDGLPLTTDQRGGGFRRVLQARVDIGAFEAAPAADLVGFLNGGWWVGATDGTKFTTTRWAGWASAEWDALGEADFNGDGRSDVYGLLDGAWWVALSTGAGYTAASRWTAWSNTDWQNVTTADLDGDGRADILARLGGQWWAALSNGPWMTSGFGTPRLWASWAALDWREFFLTDLDGDGRDDLLGYARGQWWAGFSNGAVFAAPKLFASWSDAAWQKLLVLDANGDGKSDIVGLLNGQWWAGLSSDTGVATSLWARWSNVVWADPLIGDFNGDGRDDVLARNGGNWWVGQSAGVFFYPPFLLATWSNVAWKDVRIADFDGDGRDDLTSRFNGQWWVGRSIGPSFETTLWATWTESAWRAIGAVDATGPASSALPGAVPSGSASAGSRLMAFAAAVIAPSVARQPDDESLILFWIQTSNDDDEFAGHLLAAN